MLAACSITFQLNCMYLQVWLHSRYGGVKYDSEQFNTAGRTIKSGLLACDTVSHWCWPTTLLQSSVYVYKSGIVGGYWYSQGLHLR